MPSLQNSVVHSKSMIVSFDVFLKGICNAFAGNRSESAGVSNLQYKIVRFEGICNAFGGSV